MLAITLLEHIENYNGIIMLGSFGVGWITLCVSLVKPLSGIICASIYPITVLLSNLFIESAVAGGAVCIWGTLYFL